MLFLIVLELFILFLFCMSEYVFIRYKDSSFTYKLVWRFALWIPLISIIVLNMNMNYSIYSLICLIIFITIMIADIFIINSFLIGLGIFLLVHIGNGINMTIIYNSFNLHSILIGIVILSINIFIFFKFFFKTLSDNVIKIALVIYLITLSWALWRGFSILLSGNILLGIVSSLGVLLFYFCDLQIAFIDVLKTESPLTQKSQILNHVLYYCGLLLIVITAYLI